VHDKAQTRAKGRTSAKAPVKEAMTHRGGGETDLIVAMEVLKPLVKEHRAARLEKIVDLLD
jgi:hypothetical protein